MNPGVVLPDPCGSATTMALFSCEKGGVHLRVLWLVHAIRLEMLLLLSHPLSGNQLKWLKSVSIESHSC